MKPKILKLLFIRWRWRWHQPNKLKIHHKF